MKTVPKMQVMIYWRVNSQMEAGVFSGVVEMVDTLSRINEAAYERNLERWPSSGSDNASGGGSGANRTQASSAESLRSWLETKIKNVDRLIDEMVAQFAESSR